MTASRYDLCGTCAAQEMARLLPAGMTLIRVSGGVNNKVTCWGCGKRRYGATYELRREGKK